MTETERLHDGIRERLDEHRHKLSEKQRLIDGTMKVMLAQRERFATAAHQMLESVVRPRLVELARQFDNAAISDWHAGANFHCTCEFAHAPRFPAAPARVERSGRTLYFCAECCREAYLKENGT